MCVCVCVLRSHSRVTCHVVYVVARIRAGLLLFSVVLLRVHSVLLSSVSDIMLSSDDQYGPSSADKVLSSLSVIDTRTHTHTHTHTGITARRSRMHRNKLNG